MKSNILPSPYFEIVSTALLVVFSLLYLWYGSPLPAPVREVPFENAITAAERMKDWSIWLTGLETGTMAAMGLLAKDRHLSLKQRRWAFFALIFLSLSLLLSVWVVASLPGIILQFDRQNSEPGINDLYYHTYKTATRIHLSTALGLQHSYFMIGVTCFSVFVYLTFLHNEKDA
jgi:hypothetical protein